MIHYFYSEKNERFISISFNYESVSDTLVFYELAVLYLYTLIDQISKILWKMCKCLLVFFFFCDLFIQSNLYFFKSIPQKKIIKST